MKNDLALFAAGACRCVLHFPLDTHVCHVPIFRFGRLSDEKDNDGNWDSSKLFYLCIAQEMEVEQQQVELVQADAFTNRLFSGNPAGVCLLKSDQPVDWMQSVALEMNLAEVSGLFEFIIIPSLVIAPTIV